jgi:hypothetical protein
MPAPHKPVTNPLTIIAIFAGIIEASSLASLPFLEGHSQDIYTWFLVGFPPFLTLLFFVTLNFNHKTLYSPSEFNDPQDFLNAARPAAPVPVATAPPKPPTASVSQVQSFLAMTQLRLFERDVHLIELPPGACERPLQALLAHLLETLGDTDLAGGWVVLACAGALPQKGMQDLRRTLQSHLQGRDTLVLLLDIVALQLTPVRD